MSSSFDPYYQWLGIPAKDQPPNHYRLLSIELFEQHPDVIERAADRHMAHLRTLQSGRNAADSQRLLNEIAAAKVCLLNPERKAEYDRSLKAKLASAPAPAVAAPMARVIEPQMRAAPAMVPLPHVVNSEAVPDTVDLVPVIAVEPNQASAIRRGHGSHIGSALSSPKPLWQQPVVIALAMGAAGMALLTIAALGFYWISWDSSPDVVSGNRDPARNPVVAGRPAKSKSNDNGAQTSLPQPESSDAASRPAEVPEDAMQWNGNWYWFNDTPENWDDAVTLASRLKARWVAISSPEENAFVAAQMKSSSYLGLHTDQQGNWVSSLGEPAAFLNWSSSPPADADAAFIGKDGKWNAFRGNRGARLYVALEWGAEQPAGSDVLAASDQAADTRTVWTYEANGGGSYRKTAGGWIEQSAQSGMFRFDERDRTAEYVELYDPRRAVQVRLYVDRADITRSTNNYRTSYPGRWQQPAVAASEPPKTPVAGPGQTYALEFRDKAFVELAGTKGLTNIAGNYTAEMWMRLQPTATAAPLQYLMGDGALGGVHPNVAGVATAGWFLVAVERPQAPPASSSSLIFRWGEASGQTLLTSGITPTLSGDWHHVALCNAANPGGNWTLAVYVDGKSAANHTRPYTPGLASPGNLYVGSPEFTRSVDQFHGSVRAFRLSSSVRYSQPFNPPSNFAKDADTLVLLDFSQAGGSQIADISGNGHDGKISGATWVVVDPMKVSPPDTAAAAPPALAQQKPKTPPPAADEQKKTLDQIKAIFSAEYERAKSPVEQLTLAETFLKNAAEESDATAKYVLLQQARDLAAEAGNWYMAVRAVDELNSVYEIDAVAMKVGALKSFSTFARLPVAKRTLAELAIDVTKEAVDRDQYDIATEVLAMAVSAARSSGDRELLKTVLARGTQVSQDKQVWKSAQEAEKVVSVSPDDPAANLTIGRYLGFVKGDWAAALEHFAKGEDTSLADLAKTDLTNPSDAEQQMALADQWVAWGDKASGTDQNGAWVRAQYWYGEALPKLSGLSKAGVSKKLEELADKTVPIGGALQARFAWLDGPVGELRRLTGHSQQVAGLAVSRSGRLLASASYDGTVRIWELATGKELKQVGNAASGNIYSVVFTADEKFVIVGTNRPNLTVLSVESGAPTGQIKTQYAVHDLAISTDGRKLLWTSRTTAAGNVGLLDIAGARDIGRLSCPSYPNAVTFSADGRLALTGDQSNLALIWDLLTGKAMVRIDGHTSAVNDVAFSPDGRLVATCTSNDVYVWNAKTGQQVHHFANISSPRCVAFSPDNRRLLSGGYYSELIVWDVSNGSEVQRLRGNPPTSYLYVQSLAYLPDPRGAVTGSNDGTIRVWRLPD